MKLKIGSEQALVEAAAEAAICWRDRGISRLIVGFSGDLGVGKTTWVRAMLVGLGHRGRVPSPTFTLLEHYEVGSLTVVHLDLYRLSAASELEFLGIRDWLALPQVWLLAEWPERGGPFAEAVDLTLTLTADLNDQRLLVADARSACGQEALDAWLERDIK